MSDLSVRGYSRRSILRLGGGAAVGSVALSALGGGQRVACWFG